MRRVIIYTDGACSGNPGPGGWGAVLMYNSHRKEIHGGEENTTNNRMEMKAVMEALRALKGPCAVDLYSDSRYVIDTLSKGWAKKWRANGWKRNKKEPALNADLWEELLNLADIHAITYYWVRGHAGNAENERCDALARSGIPDPKV